ncbi:hypothetical protein Tco_1403071 [Tanacetum coccineum]
MACSLPHIDSEVEALVQRLINEDKGRQDVLLNLAFQFEDSCAVRDDLRKAYDKCNDISQESRVLICTLLKESSEKDRKLHLSMYRKAAQLEKQMDAKLAWFQENTPVVHTEVSLRKLGYNVMTSLAVLLIGLGGLKFSESDHDPRRVCPRHQLPLSGILRSHSRQLRENPTIQRSEALCLRCLHEECQFLLPEKIMASGKNGDDGDLLLFRDGPGACDISAGTLRLASQVFLEWNVPWRLPIPGSCQIRCIAWFEWLCILCLEDMSGSVGFKHCIVGILSIGAYRRVHIILDPGAGVNLYVLNFFP